VTSPIDPTVLGAWLGADAAAVADLLRKFAGTAKDAEREIRAAVQKGDLATTAAAAHKLNGAARAVGATGVAKVSASMERYAKAGDRMNCSDALGPLAGELRRASAAIGE
jgi:HPt (histidine-containing phosphotransfer) domain-containing protein